MSYYGKNGNQYQQQIQHLQNRFVSIRQYYTLGPDVQFEYTGDTELNVEGAVTGRKYCFIEAGKVQPVDHRDASSMMNIKMLKRVA
ncbi:MAG: hypothetical protein QM802_13825 [Agriterribacter sp.]